MTMTTVGYGDVVSGCCRDSTRLGRFCELPSCLILYVQPAKTNAERIVAVVCMIVGAGGFAYVIGSICGLIQSLDAEGQR